jgi:general secretion pathway protein N
MRIRWNLKITLICGLLLYLLTLIWTLPAAVVWKQLQPRLPVPVTIHGLTGTLWSGQAGQLVVDGINQGRLDWRWRPGMLLSGAIGLELQWQPRNGQVLGQLRIRPGALSLHNISGELDASSMAIIHNAPFALGGKWLLDVPELTLENLEHVSGARGRLVWQEAAGGLPQAMPFGHLTAELDQADGWLLLRLQDQGGPLGLRGDARWRPGQPMKINAQLQARADAEPALASGLGLLGRADNQGWIRWRAQLQ